MRAALTFSGTRRAKWLVAGVWLAVFVGLNAVNIFEKFADAEQNRTVDYLPEKAESVKVLEQIDEFPSGERFAAVVVYRRDGGLTAADQARIAEDRRELEQAATAGRPPPPIISRDRTTALNVVPFKTTGEGDIVTRDVDNVREAIDGAPPGLQVEITGAGRFAADAIDVFESINGTLLPATALLVFVLLILIYRSPIFWLIPFFSVIVAEVSSRGLGYLLSELGVDGDRPVLGDPHGAGVRRGHRLRAADRGPLPRGAAAPGGQARRGRDGDADRRPRDRGLRRDGDGGAALPLAGRGERHRRPGADRRDGDRPGDARDVHAAAGAARDLSAAARSGRSSRTTATREPTRRTASGAGSPSASAPGRAAVWIGSTALLAVLCSASSSSTPTSRPATSSATRRARRAGQELVARAFPAGANAPNTVLVPNPLVADRVQRRCSSPRGGGDGRTASRPARRARASTSRLRTIPTRARRSTRSPTCARPPSRPGERTC